MARYIDVEQLDVIAYETKGEEEWTEFDDGVSFILDKIDNAPTADVVEVVRCKDCKFSGHSTDPIIGCDVSVCDYYPTSRIVSGEGFCDRGERRNDD